MGSPAPSFTLKTLNAALAKRESVTLADHIGPKAKNPKRKILLTFGASYCAPCRAEWVKLAERHRAIEAAGVQLLAVVIDREEQGQKEMARFVETELEAPFPVLLDRFGILARRYQASALPYSLIIDGDSGVISEVHVGYEEKVLDALIKKLSAAPAKAP